MIFLYCCLNTLWSQTDHPDLKPEAKAKFNAFFEAFHRKDTSALGTFAHRDTPMHTLSVLADGRTRFRASTYGKFLQSLASLPDTLRIEERILSVNVQQDGGMVHIWAPYEFYVDKKFSHSGVNSLDMVKTEGSWKIVHFIDTRKRGE